MAILEVDAAKVKVIPNSQRAGVLVLKNPTDEQISEAVSRGHIVLPVYDTLPESPPENPFVLKPMLARFDAIFYYRLTGICEEWFQ